MGLYGDNIFESTDIVIDRLFESINNDMMLFDGLLNESVINENAKETFNKIIDRIKHLIDMIKQKINEIKTNFKEGIIVKKWEAALKRVNTPASILMPKGNEIKEFIDAIFEYKTDVSDIVKDYYSNQFEEGYPLQRQKLDNSDKLLDKYYMDNHVIDFTKLCYRVALNTDDDKNMMNNKDIRNKLTGYIRDSIHYADNISKLIHECSNRLNEISKDIKKNVDTSKTTTITDKGLNGLAFESRELINILRYAKDILDAIRLTIFTPHIVK